ncbi:MAG TPA: ankyrin repeat domain-containing protein, partial [Spirochaetia bacterium]
QRAQNLCELVRSAPADVVAEALSAGARAEDRDEDQWTPLMYAAERNQSAKVVAALVAAGAVVDSAGPKGFTPLMLAARVNPNPEVVTALLKAGANGALTTDDGKTAFEWAAGNAKLKGNAALKALERAQSIFQMVRTCAAADVQNAVTAGADINGRDDDGLTPLMIAARRNGDAKVIAAIVKAGANLNDVTDDGMTTLMLAARDTRSPDVVTALLKAGADGLLKSNEGKTAYDYAKGNARLKGTAALKALDKACTPPPPPEPKPAPTTGTAPAQTLPPASKPAQAPASTQTPSASATN